MLTALAVARLGLRRRLGALVVLTLLVALVAGAVLTLIGGARRTVSTLERLRQESLAGDLFVQPFEADERLDDIRAHPDVEAVAQRAVAFLRIEGTDPDLANESVAAAAVDDQYLRTVDQPKVLEGALPDPEDANAVVVTETAVEEFDLAVGDHVRIESLTQEQMEMSVFGGEPISSFDGPRVEVEVAAVVRPLDDALDLNVDRLLFTPAFWAEHGDAIGGFDNLVLVRAREGADLDALTADIRELWPDDPEIAVLDVGEATSALGDLLRTQAIGLVVAAAAIAVAGLVVVAQALRRSTGDDDVVLSSVGLTRAQRTLVAAAPLALTVVVGVMLALVGAWLASGLFPTGRAERVEPSPGLRLDAPLLALGGLVGALVGASLVTVVAVRATRSPRSPSTVGRVARAVSRGPAPVSAAAHLATRQGVPARPAVAGAVVALAGVVAAAVFGASLNRLIDDPVRDGWAWDAEVGIGDGLSDDDALVVAAGLADRANVDGVALVRYAQIGVAGADTQTAGVEPVEGDVGLLVLEGAAPVSSDEVALGPETADALGAGVGDEVELEGPAGPESYTVTGLVRFPNVADDDPANGVALTLDALAALVPPDPEFGPPGFPTLLARWSPGADGDAMVEELGDEFLLVNGPRPSNQVLSLREVRGLAPTLVVVLGVLGLAAVVHALIVSVRRARRDVGVLAAVGFDRRQRATMVLAQSVGYLGIGLLLGLPLGLIVGRWTWRLLADQLAVANDPLVPGSLVLVVPVALVVAVLAALLPARAAARLDPAEHLRAE